MALSKVTYVDGVTVIGAANLNAIQDEVIANGEGVANAVPKTRTVNTKPLSGDIILNAGDIGYSGDGEYADGTLGAAVQAKADNYGTAENLIAGSAENLLADSGANDQVPYVFRKTPNHAGRLTDKIVGGTIAWNQARGESNQLVADYDGITTSYDSTTHKYCIENLSRTTNYGSGSTRDAISDIKPIVGHKILVTSTADKGIAVITKAASVFVDTIPINTIGVVSTTSNPYINFTIRITNQYDFVNDHPAGDKYYFYLNVFDLTQMFGSAIADQIYAMETATAGAGVAFFKSLFPKDYYAYNAGELMSVNTSAHVTVGKNLCANIVRGYCGGSATAVSVDNASESVVFFAYEGAEYIVSSQATLNRSCVGRLSTPNVVNGTPLLEPAINLGNNVFTWTATWTGWTIWYVKSAKDEEFEATAQVEFGSTATAYEPYEQHTYPLDSSLTLRGVPKLDANNKVYYDGDTYEADGKVTRRYGVVDLGTLTWSTGTDSTGQYFVTASLTDQRRPASSSVAANAICVKYPVSNAGNVYNGSIAFAQNNNNIYVRDTTYADKDAFATAMSGVYLVYELATPTTETADPYQNPQLCSQYGTEEYIDAGASAATPTRDVAVPVGHDTFYHEDLKGKIEGLPWDLSVIAPVLTEFKADTALVANDFRMINNELYRITASIASGGTITPNTNATKTDIATILKGLLT